MFHTRLLPRVFLSNAEVQLAVVPVTDAGDGPVCHSGALRAVEQTAEAVAHTIDTDGLAGGVPAAVTRSRLLTVSIISAMLSLVSSSL